MYEVSVSMNFSAAHNLRGYQGKCEVLHGHNWKVEVVLRAERLDKAGMVEDFTFIKGKLKEILSLFDHKYLNTLSYFKKMNPTSENIAKIVYGKMKERMRGSSVLVDCVKVWETDTSVASYREP
ncbi:MAG: 6-carboxytetrahydropterin synthase QueD [Candidatus Omnitrophota bacterium]|jgi:6-pyruvoyltetrahydropterin/6-carboxytetrahydropterin synthase|nr:6-carboxytetrahydropterin synthase QueD [Candidatus Omnitrophota bacterium]MDD5137880.1 6-carboxytetrahydropterin synthase QueD [Candidatus Omnitrophota bacterium]MDD5538379.1 6-carboxytetrahydropterin synthase QueD [Candidatus Omnitrophota bacterium]